MSEEAEEYQWNIKQKIKKTQKSMKKGKRKNNKNCGGET
jgi:hypothetical protein